MVDITAAEVFRDFETDGIPSSGPHNPRKSDIRRWGKGIEAVLGATLANGSLIYATRAAIQADLAHAANAMAWVLSDPVTENNGIYMKVGVSGSGSWTRLGDLPYSFIVASNTGEGSPDAIVATTAIPISGSALIILPIAETNLASPVTVSFNDDDALTIKTNSGNDPSPGGLVSGMSVLGLRSGSTFRLVNDQVSSAIVAAAEAAAETAAEYASLARNDFVWRQFAGDGVNKSFDLGADPGSAQNVFAFVEGIRQTNISLSGTVITFDEAPPSPSPGGEAVNVKFAFGFRVAVGTPADGSITTPKLGAGSVTPEKLAQVTGARNAVLNPRFLCNTRAVAGAVTLAAGARGHDCWKAGAAGCTYNFVKTGNRVVLTITAGSLVQVIPGDDLETGNYVLSWSGTAQGRIDGGSFGVSGAPSAAMTAGTSATIEFNAGTLSYPQFELGYVTKFDLRPAGDERSRVERWIRKILFTAQGYANAAAQDIYNVVNFPPMAAVPTPTLAGTVTLANGTNPGPVALTDSSYTSFVRSVAAGQSFMSASYVLSCEP